MMKQTRYSTQVRGGVHEPVQGLQQLVGRLRVGLPALCIAAIVRGWPQPEKNLEKRSANFVERSNRDDDSEDDELSQ